MTKQTHPDTKPTRYESTPMWLRSLRSLKDRLEDPNGTLPSKESWNNIDKMDNL